MIDKQFNRERIALLFKKKRNEVGMTQEELANLMATTRQHISKLECKGTSNIEIIEEFCNAIQCDVFEFFRDNYDAEGTVGEIAKEILYVLLERGGYILVQDLAKEYMYGMDRNRVNKEIVKLTSIGMCEREEFTDFYGIQNDGLFITAKGLITLKNTFTDGEKAKIVSELLKKVKTYEMILGNEPCYQRVLDKRELEKRVRNLKYCGSYRIDYLQWLHKKFHRKNYGTEAVTYPSCQVLPSLPGENVYVDIIFRMATELDNEDLEEVYFEYLAHNEEEVECKEKIRQEKEYYELRKGLHGEFYMDDESIVERVAEEWFLQNSEYLKKSDEEYQSKFSYHDPELEEDMCVYNQRLDKLMGKGMLLYGDFDYRLKEVQEKKKTDSPNPTEWFSDDEVIEFLKKNYKPAETEEEKKLDQVLKKLNEDFPETLEYYCVPATWIVNGIDKMICETYGLLGEEWY